MDMHADQTPMHIKKSEISQKCLSSLAVREVQMKTTLKMSYYPIQNDKDEQTTNSKSWQGGGWEKREPSFTLGGIVIWSSHSGNQGGEFSET